MRSPFFLFFLLCLPLSAVAADDKKINILYLNSYHNGYEWSDSILGGVRDTFDRSGKNIYLQIEYMDSKRYSQDKINEILFQYYLFKFRATRFDLIVTSDNNAYEFIIRYGERLFPGVPIVFCGLNDVAAGDVPMRHRMTGLLEEFDVPANIAIAARLHPGRKRLVVIGDRSLTGVAIANQVRAQISRLPKDMRVDFLDEFTLEELIELVRSSSGDSIFFFIPFYKDVGETVYSAQDLLEIVWRETGVPLYAAWEFLLGHGMVGGKLVSGHMHGQAAARIGLRILGGERPAEIPVTATPDEPPRFDYQILTRLGIDQKLLPPGSQLINAPSPFYSINRHQFWTIIVGLAVLSAVLVLLMVNIWKRKAVELRIKNQLAFLRTLMDTLPVPMYFTDESGAIRGINRTFGQWFGMRWDTDEDFRLLSPRVRDSRFDPLLDRRVDSFETRILRNDGTLRSVVLHKRPYADSKGETAGMVGVLHDISDRKQAEDGLRAAEEKYRTIFENSALGIFRATPGGDWLAVNPALARMLGFPGPRELMDDRPNISGIYFQQSDRERIVGLYRQGQDSVECEVLLRTRSGAVITATLNARAVRDAEGAFRYFEGFVEDITDRKKAELALAASEAMLQLVLDTIPQLVHWKDRNLRILGANRNFLTHVGAPDLAAIVGRTYGEIAADSEQTGQITRFDEQVIERGEPIFRLELEARSASGQTIWLLANKVPLHGPHGEVVGMLSTAEDITQTRNLEKQLIQSQKMEAIGTLAGGIAHDFNNILTSIMNSTELAMEEVPGNSLVWQDLERCLRASVRGQGLVRQILAFSRPTQKGFVPTDLRDVVTEAAALIRPSMPCNIRVTSTLEENPPLCMADPTQIHQVVMNLATNAFQALDGERGGRIGIDLGQTLLAEDDARQDGLEPGRYLVLSIADDGPGIDEAIQNKIYDPFFTTKNGGTGLGLAVVHGIVRGHGGAVRLHTSAEGTRFDIFLPAVSDGAAVPREYAGQAERGGERLFFIEDDEEQLSLIPRVLKSLGYTVHAFRRGREALQAVDEGERPDLVLTDYDMPGMNGVELARALAQRHPDLPLVMFSGRKHAGEFSGLPENILFFLSKPYNKDMIGRAVRNVLDRERACPES